MLCLLSRFHPPVGPSSPVLQFVNSALRYARTHSILPPQHPQVMSQSQEVVGKASVGGPFDLIDYNGKRFTDKNLRGEFALLYFGFTHCPDICPEELEKIASAIDQVKQTVGPGVRGVGCMGEGKVERGGSWGWAGNVTEAEERK